MPGYEQTLEAQAQQIVAELRSGRRSSVIFGKLDPNLVPRIRQILAGDTLPRFENSDD